MLHRKISAVSQFTEGYSIQNNFCLTESRKEIALQIFYLLYLTSCGRLLQMDNLTFFFLNPYKQYTALSLRLYSLHTYTSCYTPTAITKGTFRHYMAFVLRVLPVKLFKYKITIPNQNSYMIAESVLTPGTRQLRFNLYSEERELMQ